MQAAGTYLSRTLSDVLFFNSIYIPQRIKIMIETRSHTIIIIGCDCE